MVCAARLMPATMSLADYDDESNAYVTIRCARDSLNADVGYYLLLLHESE